MPPPPPPPPGAPPPPAPPAALPKLGGAGKGGERKNLLKVKEYDNIMIMHITLFTYKNMLSVTIFSDISS